MGCRCHIIIVALALSLLTGCVERRFRVESNPAGAYVYVNNQPMGPTPVDVPFIYYGDYDIKIVKEGYQTLRVKQEVSAPWYQYPIIDFFSENFWPGQITDYRPYFYELEPVIQPNIDLLKAEAEELRARTAELPAPRYPEEKREMPFDPPAKKDSVPPAKSATPSELLPSPTEPKLPPPKAKRPKK